ncbi:MAG: glycerate kinase [Bacteroidales bacterium]|nr:glycerate kinase [Bacteroidales bacterium]
MRVLICPDKFKECLGALQVASCIRKGMLKVMPEAEFHTMPLADGGEGTVEALVESTGGRIVTVQVHDPLMRPVTAFFGISGQGNTAVIEMAAASGLALLKPGERNPLITSTYGTGELIKFALDEGCHEIILGIGGSATVDGGVGMAQALGITFRDELDQEIAPGGGNLNRIVSIDKSNLDPRLSHCNVYAACDVSNPLTGPTGAALVYGPQKGATPAVAKQLDDNLRHLGSLIRDLWNREVDSLAGSGAAGGLGGGIVAFLNGELRSGFELISRAVKLEKWMGWADLVITGEGKMDAQTAFGKTAGGVARMARSTNKPVIAFAGSVEEETDKLLALGFTAVIPIADRPMTLQQSMADAGSLLENAAERVGRMLVLGKRL